MKILRTVCMIVFALILLLGGLLFLGPSLPYAPLGTLEVKIVKSGSMEPSITTGGIVALRPSVVYNLGDVITFDGVMTQIPTTHRIVGFEENNGTRMLVTKGDANEERDNELVPLSQVRGKVLFSVPYIGYILDFARKPIGFLLLIVLPAFMIIIDEVEKIWKETRKLRKGKNDSENTGTSIELDGPTHTLPHASRTMAVDIVERMERVTTKRFVDIRRVQRGVVSAPIQPRTLSYTRGGSTAGRDTAITFMSVVVLNAMIFSSLAVGSTASYFSDMEGALANRLSASAVDFTVQTDGDDYVFIDGVLNEPGGAVVYVVTPEVSSSPLLYSLSIEVATGTPSFCAALHATTTSPFAYSGPLLALSTTNSMFLAPLELALSLGVGTSTPGDFCSLTLVYQGHRADVASSTGYIDEERVPLTLSVGASAPSAFRAFVTDIVDLGTTLFEDIASSTGTTTASTTASSAPTENGDETPPPIEEPIPLTEGVEIQGTIEEQNPPLEIFENPEPDIVTVPDEEIVTETSAE